jgi:hypothetical protein
LQHFFNPRKLEVILARGSKRVDNGTGPVPDLDAQIKRTARSSSPSSTSHPTSHKGDRKGKGTDRRDQRQQGSMTEMGRTGDVKQYRLFVVGL